MELTIKSAWNKKEYMEFLFLEKIEELGKLRKQTYDLHVRGTHLAKMTMDANLAVPVLSKGFDFMKGLKTKWKVEGESYELIKIWNPNKDHSEKPDDEENGSSGPYSED